MRSGLTALGVLLAALGGCASAPDAGAPTSSPGSAPAPTGGAAGEVAPAEPAASEVVGIVVRIDAEGHVSGAVELPQIAMAYAAAVAPDGELWVAGTRGARGGVPWLGRVAADGTVRWESTLSDLAEGTPRSVIVTDAEVVVTGEARRRESAGRTSWQLFAARFIEGGERLGLHEFGGDRVERGGWACPLEDGGLYLVGTTYSVGDRRDNDGRVYVVRVGARGEKVWERSWGTLGASLSATGVSRRADGGAFVAGSSFLAGRRGFPIALRFLDPDGRDLWSRTLDEPAPQSVFSASPLVVSAGEPGRFVIVSSGSFGVRPVRPGATVLRLPDPGVWAARLDADGAFVWRSHVPKATAIAAAGHGGVVAVVANDLSTGEPGLVLLQLSAEDGRELSRARIEPPEGVDGPSIASAVALKDGFLLLGQRRVRAPGPELGPGEAPPAAPPPAEALAAVGPLVGNVIVDRGQPAYTLYYRVPDELTADELAAMRASIARQPEVVEVVAWERFREEAKTRIDAARRKDDYPECGVVDGILALLERYPGAPFSVTFNGGIAFTRNDYEHAKRLHARWTEDPDAPTRPEPGRWDRIHPDAHLGPLLRKKD